MECARQFWLREREKDSALSTLSVPPVGIHIEARELRHHHVGHRLPFVRRAEGDGNGFQAGVLLHGVAG